MTFRRQPLELLERQGHYRYRHIAELTMNTVLRFEGRLDHAILGRALRLCADHFPVLGCRAEEGFWRVWWTRHPDLDGLTWCDVEETDAPEEALQRRLLEPFRPWDGHPGLRARIIRGPAGDILCLSSHHAYSDAKGFAYGLYFLAETYTRLRADPDYLPGLAPDYRRDLEQVFGGLSILGRLGMFRRAYRDLQAMKEPKEIAGLPVNSGDATERRYVFRSIEPDQFRALKAYGRERGASFNDLMNALFAQAVLELYGKDGARTVRFFTPVDLRRYNPAASEAEGPRNLSALAVFNVTSKEGESFDALLEECRRQLRFLANDCPGLGGYPEMWLRNWLPNGRLTRAIDDRYRQLGEWYRNGGRVNLPLQLSNAGIYDRSKLGFEGARLVDVNLAALTYFYSYFFVYSTFEDRVTMSIGYCDPDRAGPIVEAVFQRVEAQIERICSRTRAS